MQWKFLCLTLCFILRAEFDIAAGFTHEQQSEWYDDYEQCNRNRQSPIELITNEALATSDIASFVFQNYEASSSATAENTGYTASFALAKPWNYLPALWQVSDKQLPHMSGGPLPYGIFVAEGIHFHWGSRDDHGSEHVIDSERLSLEMHIVHRNSKYQTIDEALAHADGVAVLGLVYRVQSTFTGSSGLEPIINALEAIEQPGQASASFNLTLSGLLADVNREEYFTYEGSLTTPPCSEAVTWTVFSHIMPISHFQLNRFRRLSNAQGNTMHNNYRALQAKGNRQVILRKQRNLVAKSSNIWDNGAAVPVGNAIV